MYCYRDVKSLNVFTTKTDLLKLGDFGISKVLESSSQLAETVSSTHNSSFLDFDDKSELLMQCFENTHLNCWVKRTCVVFFYKQL